MTNEDEYNYAKSFTCYFCGNEFNEMSVNLRKVRDHDHMTGKYRCAAHSECNLKYSKQIGFVPIFFHNLGGNIVNNKRL